MKRKRWTPEEVGQQSVDPDWHDDTVEAIRPLLAGRAPQQQGAVLLDLVAIWVVGHHPAMRNEVLELWVKAVKGMVPVVHEELYGEDGFPQ